MEFNTTERLIRDKIKSDPELLQAWKQLGAQGRAVLDQKMTTQETEDRLTSMLAGTFTIEFTDRQRFKAAVRSMTPSALTGVQVDEGPIVQGLFDALSQNDDDEFARYASLAVVVMLQRYQKTALLDPTPQAVAPTPSVPVSAGPRIV